MGFEELYTNFWRQNSRSAWSHSRPNRRAHQAHRTTSGDRLNDSARTGPERPARAPFRRIRLDASGRLISRFRSQQALRPPRFAPCRSDRQACHDCAHAPYHAAVAICWLHNQETAHPTILLDLYFFAFCRLDANLCQNLRKLAANIVRTRVQYIHNSEYTSDCNDRECFYRLHSLK